MRSQQFRPVIFLLIALTAVWAATTAAYAFFKHSKMTAAKVEQHLQETDLTKLSGPPRAEALNQLMADINALPPDERQKFRQSGAGQALFGRLDDGEKSKFVEGTMPGGVKQVLQSFEQMTPEKRRQAIDQVMRHLRENSGQSGPDTNAPALSPELQQKMVNIGLKTFYANSDAQTKAELAPVLDEMQQMMEKGTLFRRGD